MEIVLALVSALLFALGSVLQQRAGMESPSTGRSTGALLRLARHPVWLAGIAADGVGFVAQAAALGVGRLAVVQPLLVTSVVFAIPLGATLGHAPARRSDVLPAALVAVSLAGFLLIANPSGGRGEAPLQAWLVAGAVSAGACTALALQGRHGAAPRRAAFLGTGAGMLFALSAALTKAVVDELPLGVVHVLVSWELYALVGVGYVSMTLNQLALNTGALAATLATSAALDPITSVVLGLTLFHEVLHTTVLQKLGTGAALIGALLGMLALARSQVHPTSGAGGREP